ncbi:hypothetical protein HPP92_026790 [Vanilla planifolia]|uniref:DUF155 domain-containing protein n=1 Tax=Vanilla planifolia TaxID=51239 RepID=A0A835PFF1_VANPL|nr:hypothetical protein HPP92_026790 [Vanilla planifolia]
MSSFLLFCLSQPTYSVVAFSLLLSTQHFRPLHYRSLFFSFAIDPAQYFSSLSPSQELDSKDSQQSHQHLSSEGESCDEHLLEVQQAKQGRFIPVKAYFLCTSIDLRSLQAQNAFNVIPPSSRATNYVVLRYYDVRGDQAVEFGSINESKYHYMVVFQYGSIVLFNVSDHEADGYLKVVEKHASGLLPDIWKDAIMMFLAVDGMVAEFTDINRGMEKTGTFTMQRKKLFQLVGKANSNMADVILKLGLFESFGVAERYINQRSKK